MGGKDDRQILRSVERLDCDTETWDYAHPMPHKVYDHAAAVLGGQVPHYWPFFINQVFNENPGY